MSILATIIEKKREELARAKKEVSLDMLKDNELYALPRRDFAGALRRDHGQPIRALTEFKRASPSAGAIRPSARPSEVVPLYEANGAAALSILTDVSFFDGHPSFLKEARECCELPLLRKDFMIDPYQLVEAKALAADAVLLIVAVFEGAELDSMLQTSKELGLDALVEVHDEKEMEQALAAGATLLGVNHRNLRTFEIDMTLTPRLAGMAPPGTILVGESGIRTREDVVALEAAGAHAFLVGESLMRAENPGHALAALLGAS